MAVLTVRNLPDEVHRSLRVRAARNGRSTEAEVRAILTDIAKPERRIRMGDALAALGRKAGLSDADIAFVEHINERTPAEPLEFGCPWKPTAAPTASKFQP